MEKTLASIPNFLEVTINSEKLVKFISKTNELFRTQQKKIQDLQRQWHRSINTLEDKIKRQSASQEYEVEKMTKNFMDADKFLEVYLKNINLRVNKLEEQTQLSKEKLIEKIEKVDEKHERLITFNENQVKLKVEEILQKHQEQKENMVELENKFEALKKVNMSQMASLCKKLFDSTVCSPAGERQEYEKEYERTVVKRKNVVDHKEIRSSFNRFDKNMLKQEKRSIDFNRDMNHSQYNKMSMEYEVSRDGKQRKKKKAQDNCLQQNLQYASISAKIDQLETRLVTKQNQSLNKILYPIQQNKAIMKQDCIFSEASNNNLSVSMDRIEMERKELEQKITLKLEHIEEIINEKYLNLNNQIVQLKNKSDISNDQIDILNRKMEKQKIKFNDFAIALKKIQEKKLDQKMIQNLVNLVKRNTKNLEEALQQKVNSKDYDRERTKIQQKVQILSSEIFEKADKAQIKKAFIFLEDKIREIVVIIADDLSHEKDGALKKIPVQCLSCSKDLDTNVNINMSYRQKKPISRCNSTQMRRRIKVNGSHSMTPGEMEIVTKSIE